MKAGWQTKMLCDVSEVFDGPHATPKTVDIGPIFLGIGALRDGALNLDETRHVTEEDFRQWTRRVRPQANDVVFSYETRLGQAAIIPEGLKCCLGRRMGLVRLNSEAVVPRFFLYQYVSPQFREFLASKTIRGATVDRISIKDFPSFPILVPPLAEQQRIVTLLDEAFDGIATARACAEKNLQNARAIFESHLQLVFEHRGTGWFEKRLADVCAITSKLVDPRKPEFLDLTHVGAGNIESKTGAFVELKTAREEGLISGKFLFDETMVLYSKIRPYLMKVARPDFGGLCSADMYPLSPNPDEADRNYLFHLLLSKHFTDYAIEGSARAGMPKVNREHLFEFRVCLPSVSKQREIAAKLDELHKEAQRLESLYQRKLTALNELKNSLLHQAFSGQLTSAKPTSVSVQAALQTTTPEFTANIISLAHARHERQKREKTFGHVKEQKLLHLVESIARIDLGRRPMKDAAGPNDFPHMRKAEEWAKAHHFFEMVKRDGGYDFKKLSAFDEHFSRARQALAPYLPQLESVIDLLVPMDTGEAEVFATVHAAWNNLLIDGLGVTDDAIVSAAREGWHADKLSIPKDRFRAAIALIRQKNLVPDGTAKYVGGQPRLI